MRRGFGGHHAEREPGGDADRGGADRQVDDAGLARAADRQRGAGQGEQDAQPRERDDVAAGKAADRQQDDGDVEDRRGDLEVGDRVGDENAGHERRDRRRLQP